jgi:hypothetical protein
VVAPLLFALQSLRVVVQQAVVAVVSRRSLVERAALAASRLARCMTFTTTQVSTLLMRCFDDNTRATVPVDTVDANAFPDTVRGEPVEPWTVSASAVHPSTGSGRTALW